MFLWSALKASDIVRAANALADITEERKAAAAQLQTTPEDPPLAGNSSGPLLQRPQEGAKAVLRNQAQSPKLS